MNSVYELTELLEFVVDRALGLTNGRRGVLLLCDEECGRPDQVAVMRVKNRLARPGANLHFISTTVINDVWRRANRAWSPTCSPTSVTRPHQRGHAALQKTRSVLAYAQNRGAVGRPALY